MRFLLSITLLFCLSRFSSAQTQSMLFEKWWGTYDDCILYYADELPNGDFILVGGQKSTLLPPGVGPWQNYMCRMDFKGNILWEKNIGDPYANNYAGGVTKTSHNSYVLIGTTYGGPLSGYTDISAWNIDVDGNVLFEKYFTSAMYNSGGSVIETSDSCFVFVCKLGIPTTSSQVPSMIKIDRNGNEIWRHRQDTLEGHPVYIRQTSDSGFIVLGAGVGVGNCYYAKYKPDGEMDWIKYPFGLADTISNYPSTLRANQDGTFDIFYGTNFTIGSDPPIYGLLKHYDHQGNCSSVRQYFNPYGGISLNLSDSTLWSVPGGNYSLYIMDSDNNFNQVTQFNVVQGIDKWIHNYTETKDGGFLGVGQYREDQNGYPTFYIAKFGSDGRYQPDEFSESVSTYPNPSTDGNITLTFDMLKDDDVQVDIYTSDGKLVYTTSIFCPANSHTEKPIRLDLLSASGGMYILQARTSDAVIRKKLIVRGD